MTPEPLLQLALCRSRTLAVFDADHYRSANPDLADVDPARHFAQHGVWERRSTIAPERRLANLSALSAELSPPSPDSQEALARALRNAPSLGVCVRLPSTPSSRAVEVGERLVNALLEVGAEARLADQGVAAEFEVFVDPARTPVDPASDPALMARIARGVVVLSGPPSGGAFDEHLPCALLSAGVIAFAPDTHAVFAAAGVPSLWLTLAPSAAASLAPPPGWEAVLADIGPPSIGWADRPLDLAAFGALTERRIPAWFALAEPVARRRAFVHTPRPRPDVAPSSDIALRRFVYARSRIALHLQRETPATFDWRTVCDVALGAGALLVSDLGLRHPQLDPRLHYFEEAPRRMPALLDWLLDTPEGRLEAERRRLAAVSLLARGDDVIDVGLKVAAFLLDRTAS